MDDVHAGRKDCTLFQKHCEKIIGKLTEECIDNFKATADEEARIKFLYDQAVQIPITISPNNGKDIEIAQQEKIKGNSYFAKKDYTNALKSYNNGIIKCPQNTAPSRELLTILISNRSATYFELKEYKRVFNDIDYLTEVGNYPSHLQYKIWLRKAKCYDALQNERLSSEAYNEAVESLKHSKLDEKAVESKIKEIESSRENKTIVPVAKHELVPALGSEIFVGGKDFIAAHPHIKFEQDSYQGRFATAVEDIDTGTVIIEENPHCAVVDSEHVLTNCQYCCGSVDQPVACPSCGNVVFCCTNCERLANKTFHKVECAIQGSLISSGASVNCSLALRIISQRPFAYFNDKRNKLKDFLRDNCKKNVIRKKTYRYDDYDNVFFLCRNESLRKKEELVHYTCMATYLLRLLKAGKYFPFESKDEVLVDLEGFIGGLILRHLQLLQFNAHEISELKNPPKPIITGGVETNYESTTTGAALYPTLALFNHSCDPSIVRYNLKNKIVVRTIKPVKAGDIIYENYGPLYMSMPVEKRQETLKNNYWFECLCIPCVELWPMFHEMNEYELRIPCQTDRCPFVFIVHHDDEPFMTCDYCHNVTTIFPHLKGLMALDDILPVAEALFGLNQFEKAMRKFINGLEILYKYTKPPHPEIIKIQQRIRVCMIHMGNKACDYKVNL
ncbi:SET and MYND domain-containing protein 4-like [Anoplophora glabripennis]|uniref:SET and MYND domain-containing protein 4-like n=1 Tax=Anoplophora glabripennis TaxID=217634 RepID=UPI0008758F77|nr:SET and MYND domain-containing protein 4-like [Anoplophora glabripennis]